MKKIIILAALLLAASTAFAGEKEELALKYDNIQLQLQNIQLTVPVLQKQAGDIKAKYDAIVKVEQDAALKAATEKAKPGVKK